MKIRAGFVSNSSSSSFMCDITGEISEGYDISLTDCEMVMCEHGHTFHYDGFPEVEEWISSDDNEEGNYELPEALCPICNGKAKDKIVERFQGEMKRLKISVEDLK